MSESGLMPEMPGEYVKQLMAKAGWSQAELAYVLGVTTATVNQIVNSKRPITAEMAKLLGAAFSRPADEFAEIQTRWNLANAPEPDQEVRARAKAQSDFPLREMVKRGWINDPKESGGAHTELCRFFGVNSLDDASSLGHAAKKIWQRFAANRGTTGMAVSGPRDCARDAYAAIFKG